jgi:hypothetical protein
MYIICTVIIVDIRSRESTEQKNKNKKERVST